jgi:hypothetical protein
LANILACPSDPWWIFTTCNIFWVIKTHYSFGIIELVRESPRFGLMLASMGLSITFLILDILSVTGAVRVTATMGINPFWKVRVFFFLFFSFRRCHLDQKKQHTEWERMTSCVSFSNVSATPLFWMISRLRSINSMPGGCYNAECTL